MTTESSPPDIDPETLERLRRGIPLRMDAMGHFSLGGEPVSHPRVIAAFRRGLDITEAGEHQLHVGNQWCYLTIDDCPLRAVAVAARHGDDGAGLHIRLDDGRELPLAVDTLWEEPGRGLRCEVPAIRSGRPIAARFTNTAQMDLATWITEAPDRDELVLEYARADGTTARVVIGGEPPSVTHG